MLRALARDALAQPFDPVLRGHVWRVAGTTADRRAAGNSEQVAAVALRGHHAPRRVPHIVHAGEVDGHQPRPVSGGGVAQRALLQHRRVGHREVEPAEGIARSRDGCHHSGVVGHVARARDTAARAGDAVQLGGDRVELGAGQVRRDHAPAERREPARLPRAEAARGARDERHGPRPGAAIAARARGAERAREPSAPPQ